MARKPKKNPKSEIHNPKLTERDLRAAGLGCESIEAAAEKLGVADLPALLAAKPKLAAAWERGRFLRQVRTVGLKGIVAEEADRFFEPALTRGELLERLKHDKVLHDVWTSAALEAKLAVREGLIQRARRGEADAKVMELYERLLVESPARAESLDWENLTTTQLEQATGIHRNQWRRWEEKNGCPRRPNRRYSLPAVIAWLRVYEDTGGVKLERGMDPLRAAKVEEKELDLAERRHQLLDREQVIVGIVMRYQRLAQARQRAGDLALQLQGQDVDHTEQLLGDFLDSLCCQQIEDFAELHLAAPALSLFAKLLETLNGTADERG